VLECTTRKKRRKRVESLSHELEEAYGIEMRRIKENGKHYEIARRALAWVYFAKRPLYMAELQEALAVNPIEDLDEPDEDWRDLDWDDFEKPQTILDSCGSLILWDRSTDVVGFSHYTVSEFLAAHPDGNIEPEIYIARLCLTYLCFDFFEGGACDEFVDYERRIKRYRLAPYIARFSMKHVSESNAEESLRDLVLWFVSSPLRCQAWTELDSNYPDTISGLFPGGGRAWYPFSFKYHPYYRGWVPLHFLSLWNLAFSLNFILSSAVSDVVDLITTISGKWSRRFPGERPPGRWQSPDDWRFEPATGGHDHDRPASLLDVACQHGNVEIVQLLLSRGVNVNPLFGPGPLYKAADHGYEEIVKLLLEEGAEVNVEGGYYGYALQAAARQGNEGIVKLLLEKGAEVNIQGGKYGYALQAAAVGGHKGMVMLLLEKGAEVNVQGGDWGNALQAAIIVGRSEEIVKLLLENGAQPNVRGEHYRSALDAAKALNDEGIVKLLLEKGAVLEIE
jgi:ankyrin repeat protein